VGRARCSTPTTETRPCVAEALASNMGVLAGLSWRYTDAAIKAEITRVAPILAERLTHVADLAELAGIRLPEDAVLR